jgi:Xaa-Pro aminopeptidase
MSAQLEARRERLFDALAEHKIDVLLVSSLANIRYLAGFTGSNALLFAGRSGCVILTDPRYTLQIRQESDCPAVVAKGSIHAAASKVIARRKWRRIGVEQSRITYGAYVELGRHFPVTATLIALPPIIERLRTVKSPEEIDLIRRSVLTNSRAFDRAMKRLRPGANENDFAAEIDYQMRRAGAEKVAFETIVAAGARSALPHAQPTSDPLAPDRLVLVDMGAVQSGYCSDMTRMLHTGKPGTKARRLYKAVSEAQLAALDAVRAGVTAAAVDRAARRVLQAYGLDRSFVHSTGHGLGLEIHEPPRVGKRDKTRLEAGMVITIEPGAYVEGFGGVRIEDTVLVTKSGHEVLTPTPKELFVV